MNIAAGIKMFSLLTALIGYQGKMSYAKRMELNHETTTPSATQKEYLIAETLQEKTEKFRIPKYLTLEVRLPSNTLLKYTSYKDVSILHFRMPPDTRKALFSFKAIEEPKGTFQRKCKPRDITLHLKAGSFPVISPENITFPSNFLHSNQRASYGFANCKQWIFFDYISSTFFLQIADRTYIFGCWEKNENNEQQWTAKSSNRFKIYSAQFDSDEVQQHITVDGPQVMDWYAVAFLSWKDPNNDRIEQQGLAASCETVLVAEMSVSHIYPILIGIGQTNNNTLKSGWCDQHSYNDSAMLCLDNGNQKHVQNEQINARKAQNSTISMDINNNGSHYTSINEVIYKFYVPRNVGLATAYIAFSRVCLQCPLVGFHMQANAFPSVRTETGEAHEQASLYSTYIEVNSTDEISITFNVQPMVWHYALLKFTRESNFSLSDNLTHGIPFQFRIDYFDSFEISNFSTNYDNNGYSLKPRHFRDIELYPLLRQTYRDFFMFDYDLIPDENGTVPTLFNLTSGITTGFSFSIGEVYDIGGTLSFAVSMKNENNASSIESMMSFPIMGTASERSGILAEKLVGGDKAYKSNESEWKIGKVKQMGDPVLINQTNRTIIICMHHGEPGEPTWPDKCRYHGHLLAAASIINNSFTNTNNGLIHVPFPESGQWYITMGLYCHGADVRVNIIENVKVFVKNYAHMLESMPQYCACGTNVASYKDCVNDSKCLAAMNETVTFKIKECLLDSKCTANHLEMTHKFKIHQKSVAEQHLAIGNCSASVEFTISSSPCIAGRCGRFGKCFHYMSGGFVFSTCVCMKGYRGWDCTEDSQVPSSISILFASLILIFSNLLFIPSIYMAVCRNFYTEAVIYFFSMFFSIFYHACDSGEDEYSFCVVKIGVLQFCDFYCGLLAIWVTLVAMSHIRQQYVSLLHMVGAIMLAFATELNKQSLWAFLAPALTGICLISTSWGLRCYKSRKWFPSRKYLTIYLPLGTVLTMVGLVCYAFLQTKQNYHIVHSVWHMVMALSIQCLLPSPKSFTPKC